MYGVHKKSLYPFIGGDTLKKVQRNALFQIVDVLNINITKDFALMDLLTFFANHEFLFEVIVWHCDKKYGADEKKIIKKLFVVARWHRLVVNTDGGQVFEYVK